MNAVMKCAVLGLLILCSGCAEIRAQAFNKKQYKISEVCIQSNKKSLPYDFEYILKEGFLRHGIATKVYADIPQDCEYRLLYVATTYKKHSSKSLRNVHLALYKGDTLIGFADRDSPDGFLGKKVTDLSKWDSMRSIIDLLVDGLLGEDQPMVVK
ncbi:MAG TPA: hypothetical protein DD400_03005 [Rhodospirillaceae bacterium]|nr:hypothetical protein [Rhodospirillaceae bacterium]